jgi:hypothetical protein
MKLPLRTSPAVLQVCLQVLSMQPVYTTQCWGADHLMSLFLLYLTQRCTKAMTLTSTALLYARQDAGKMAPHLALYQGVLE